MEKAPTQFEPGDQVSLLEGSSPMTVKSVSDDGMTVVCESSNEDSPTQQEYDATKLTKLHAGDESAAKSKPAHGLNPLTA